MKTIAYINGKWITLSDNATIDNKPINFDTLSSYESPKFVELIDKDTKYIINIVFIQIVQNYKTEFSDRRII